MTIALVGCATHRSETVTTTTVTETRSRHPIPTDSLDGLAQNIIDAPDALAEAQALREWDAHLRRNKYTYSVDAYQAGTEEKVASPSVSKLPLRVQISVYRADQKLHEFSFIPKENENIRVIAKAL